MRIPAILIIGAALIGAALLAIRYMSADFYLGTTTADHPYVAFTACLMISSAIWALLIPVFKTLITTDPENAKSQPAIQSWKMPVALIATGLAFRIMFFGSTPVYEDDWNRYLWDAAVITQGQSPYLYSPDEILRNQRPNETQSLHDYSVDHDDFPARINNPKLTTIYPPVAQAAFVLAALIEPLNLDALRFVFLISEAVAMFLMVKALTLYGRSAIWVGLYALNPLLIFSAFNAAHMDVLLTPFLIGMVIAIRRHPYIAAGLLSLAAAVKIWPLLLAPIAFRRWRGDIKIYLLSALICGVVSALLLFPMISLLGDNSGLKAYSAGWQRSSFLFPLLVKCLSVITDNPGQVARIFVAFILVTISFWRGLISPIGNPDKLPAELMLIILALFLMSPTGFPWYLIWALIFISFRPLCGLALLCVLTPLYYLRFGLGELGQYDIYTNWLVPLQFALPILVLLYELKIRDKRHG